MIRTFAYKETAGAYEEALQDMISEMWSTSDETAWPDQAEQT